jgi:hypothetical protein
MWRETRFADNNQWARNGGRYPDTVLCREIWEIDTFLHLLCILLFNTHAKETNMTLNHCFPALYAYAFLNREKNFISSSKL